MKKILSIAVVVSFSVVAHAQLTPFVPKTLHCFGQAQFQNHYVPEGQQVVVIVADEQKATFQMMNPIRPTAPLPIERRSVAFRSGYNPNFLDLQISGFAPNIKTKGDFYRFVEVGDKRLRIYGTFYYNSDLPKKGAWLTYPMECEATLP